jgi:hypothetical protein
MDDISLDVLIDRTGLIMRKAASVTVNEQSFVPAAQYVRMSDEAQRYSADNQKAAIAEYAARHGFVVVKTYADLGKSGVVVRIASACENY